MIYQKNVSVWGRGVGRSDDSIAAYGPTSYLRKRRFIVRSSSGAGSTGSLDSGWQRWWKPPEKGLAASDVSLSDVLWPSAGAFAAMALLGRLDQMVTHRGLSFTIAPLGAVCAVLFTNPSAPAAKKYNVFVAQIGCAAFGVLALSIFGPGWLARAAALAASMAFMIATGSTHPPARDCDLFEEELQVLTARVSFHTSCLSPTNNI
ncbi:hypothetical protein Cni_G00494 [Canna indica]|uniref:HPP transmembrane region domain-containing protein n=1 Tax=Canna indica TaxID=4628 RepID=A0AAQ3JL63_9LILI|nr:hypothetical protein Cni_G00494 [Canna indica]